MATTERRPYHHGNLRRELLDAAAAAIEEGGPAALSLRGLAQRAGVSHAAPAHHFGDRAGLLTALAAEGYERLADALEAAGAGGDFLEAGLAYVRFASTHPAHFLVMFEPSLYRADDPEVVAARERAGAVLYGTAAARVPGERAADVGVAGWCLVHGLATLWQAGNLRHLGDDPVELARAVAGVAFGGPRPGSDVTPRR